MIHDNINVDIKLKGQYRFSVKDNDTVVYTSPWCNNTILSSGLVDLHSYDIPNIISYLDIGSSSSLPGVSGYGLSGVIAETEFKNIYRDIVESYQDTISSKVYIASFSSGKALDNITINEFAIKRTEINSFARNTLTSTYSLCAGQIINFEYKLTVNWSSCSTSNLSVTGNSLGYTYTIPIISKTYNIPYDSLYYNNNVLFLLGNIYNSNGSLLSCLPGMGDDYPVFFDWGIDTSTFSTYTPNEVSSSIDNILRRYTVNTCYSGIACEPNSEVHSNIKTALLVKDGDITQRTNKFNATQFAFPLTVYNSLVVCPSTLPSNTSFNNITLGYSYTWGECDAMPIPLSSCPCDASTPTPSTSPISTCTGNIVSFTTIPNGGSVDLSSEFTPGAYGSGDGCCSGENRVYDLRGYNSGAGYNYIIGGAVTNDGTLVWEPNGGTATLTNTFQFSSNYLYSEYMSLTIRCASDPITPPISASPP